ncbi:unnamed protein product [Mytilus edulis]|uniref:Uncharacterized protein n=1 Tax=Mytilus edulis TaxID=6550 RepID=A0A8S3SDJ9_MYTED|nr:unnamed protein product [Mytilus edulis]
MELNNSQYVLDPRTWIMYYENLANDKHHNSYLNNSYRRTIQSGGSLTNSAASFMEPITLPQSKPHAQSPIKLVTHAQQQVENAKSEISRAVKKIKRKRGKLQNIKFKMAKINPETFHELQPSQLSLFNLPGHQTAVTRITYEHIRPAATFTKTSPIEFHISGGTEYLDLSKSTMHVRLRLKRGDGTIADSSDVNCGPVNYVLHALFNQIDVLIQNKIVTSSTGFYPYKAYMQTLLKYGKEAKESQLSSQLWIDDHQGTLDDADCNTGSNLGLYRRTAYIKNDRDQNFYLMSVDEDADYYLEIEDMYLSIAKIHVHPGIVYGHDSILRTVNAKYPIVQNDVRTISLPAGQISFNFNNIFQNNRPNKVLIAFTGSQNIAGDYSLCPWTFKHCHLSEINLKVEGVPVSGNPVRVKFDSSSGESSIVAFRNLFEVAGKTLQDCGNGLNRDSFSEGYALYAFQLEPIFEGLDYLTLKRNERVNLECTFDSPLTEPTTIIIYSEFSGYFEITQTRDIIIQE